jgi:thiamine pyrophosphokinase
VRALLVGPLCRKVSTRGYDLVIGVDAGVARCLASRVRPDLAVGDWDGYRGKLEGIPAVTLPRKKDRSDLHYAFRAAQVFGATEVVCVGLTGGKPDHHLAGLHEMALAAKRFTRVMAMDADAQYHFLSGSNQAAWKAKLALGQRVSILPIGGPAHGVTVSGFEYPLRNARLEPGSRGLSNGVVRKKVSVQLKRGNLVVIYAQS